ncbi:aminopeptidase P family N-terminal domain-containing protein, partial [Streptomyces geysiriensis]|uniref:aminopeptidase P family N-terminal domain-containing protein n=1 Tax=Streptomyces geysiriensis TaxID=68207 RepID=UPI002176EE2C
MSQVYAARRTRLRERCNAGGSAAALVSRPANVRYLAGAAPEGQQGQQDLGHRATPLPSRAFGG